MKKLRILLDDAVQCRAQRAVLAAFAGTLPASTELVRTSALPVPTGWEDAPRESARRLAVRIEALAPASDTLTVFVPGHAIPGEHHTFSIERSTTPLPAWSTVGDLDLFAADNGSPLAEHFSYHRAVNPDYQSCSSYPVMGLASFPSWLVAGGFTSALLLTERPWYFVQVPARGTWLRWLHRALEQKLLSLEDVEADVREGVARPSLLNDARALVAGSEPLASPDATLDCLFACPEVRLTDQQYAILHSRALQERTLQNARLEALRKNVDAGEPVSGWMRAVRKARYLPRKSLKAAYQLYAATLRPLIRGSAANRPRSP